LSPGEEDDHDEAGRVVLRRTLQSDCRLPVRAGAWPFLHSRWVGTLFSNPRLSLAGWVRYLAFDLLVGSWELQDAREQGISHLMVVPCLALTFLFGPAGWLLYTILRSIRRTSSKGHLREE